MDLASHIFGPRQPKLFIFFRVMILPHHSLIMPHPASIFFGAKIHLQDVILSKNVVTKSFPLFIAIPLRRWVFVLLVIGQNHYSNTASCEGGAPLLSCWPLISPSLWIQIKLFIDHGGVFYYSSCSFFNEFDINGDVSIFVSSHRLLGWVFFCSIVNFTTENLFDR